MSIAPSAPVATTSFTGSFRWISVFSCSSFGVHKHTTNISCRRSILGNSVKVGQPSIKESSRDRHCCSLLFFTEQKIKVINNTQLLKCIIWHVHINIERDMWQSLDGLQGQFLMWALTILGNLWGRFNSDKSDISICFYLPPGLNVMLVVGVTYIFQVQALRWK